MPQRNNLGFGCVSLTQHTFLKDAFKILSAALNEGITHFDTAPIYGNGYSEKILGNFIRNKRSQITITTKCGLGNLDQPNIKTGIALLLNAIKNRIKKTQSTGEAMPPVPLSFRSIDENYTRQSLNRSLKNLKTDRVDFYLLHEALPCFLTDEAFLFLIEQKQKGIIGELGIGSAYINFFPLSESDIKHFNVLQYENGPSYKTDELLNKFNNKLHFYHSTLRCIPSLDKKYSPAEWAGILLNRACKINPSGKILFSTTKQKRLKENLEAFEQYADHSLSSLNNIINAIY